MTEIASPTTARSNGVTYQQLLDTDTHQVPDVLRATNGGGAIALGECSYELHRQAPGIDLYRDRQSWTPFLSPDPYLPFHIPGIGVLVAFVGLTLPGRPSPLLASVPCGP